MPQLCKSIVVENTACANAGLEDPRNSRCRARVGREAGVTPQPLTDLPCGRYYCVVLQYNARLNAEQLQRFVREQLPEAERPGRRHFNFQHAPADVRGLEFVSTVQDSIRSRPLCSAPGLGRAHGLPAQRRLSLRHGEPRPGALLLLLRR